MTRIVSGVITPIIKKVVGELEIAVLTIILRTYNITGNQKNLKKTVKL